MIKKMFGLFVKSLKSCFCNFFHGIESGVFSQYIWPIKNFLPSYWAAIHKTIYLRILARTNLACAQLWFQYFTPKEYNIIKNAARTELVFFFWYWRPYRTARESKKVPNNFLKPAQTLQKYLCTPARTSQFTQVFQSNLYTFPFIKHYCFLLPLVSSG